MKNLYSSPIIGQTALFQQWNKNILCESFVLKDVYRAQSYIPVEHTFSLLPLPPSPQHEGQHDDVRWWSEWAWGAAGRGFVYIAPTSSNLPDIEVRNLYTNFIWTIQIGPME